MGIAITAQLLLGEREIRVDDPRVLEQPRADSRELRAARAALDELHAELLLHRPDAARERGLGDREGLRGRADASLVRNLHELTQVLQIKMPQEALAVAHD